MHHAWLLGGPKGIGKATLAYRFARFAFAHPDPRAAAVAGGDRPRGRPRTSRLPPRRRTRRIPTSSPWNGPGDEDRKRFLTELSVDEIRRTVSLLRLDQRGGGLADRHRRSGRRDERQRRQRAPQGAGGAAVALAVLHHLPCAGPAAADHPLALPPARSCAAVGRGDRRGDPRQRQRRLRATADIALAAALAEGSLRRAILLLQEGGIADLSRASPRFAATRAGMSTSPPCTASPTASPGAAPTTPMTASSTPSAAGSAGGSAASAEPVAETRRRPSALRGRPACQMGGGMGEGQRNLRPRPRTSISTASRSFCRSSCRSPAPPECDFATAAATRPRYALPVLSEFTWRDGDERSEILHHHRDLLSERRAAYRPRLRGAGDRRAGPLQAARRPRRLSS